MRKIEKFNWAMHLVFLIVFFSEHRLLHEELTPKLRPVGEIDQQRPSKQDPSMAAQLQIK